MFSKYDYDSDSLHESDSNALEQLKRGHHFILLKILSYLTLRELLRVSKVNRKLYIVSGDTSLLSNFLKKQIPNKKLMAPASTEQEGYVYQCVNKNEDEDFDIILDKNCSRAELQYPLF